MRPFLRVFLRWCCVVRVHGIFYRCTVEIVKRRRRFPMMFHQMDFPVGKTDRTETVRNRLDASTAAERNKQASSELATRRKERENRKCRSTRAFPRIWARHSFYKHVSLDRRQPHCPVNNIRGIRDTALLLPENTRHRSPRPLNLIQRLIGQWFIRLNRRHSDDFNPGWVTRPATNSKLVAIRSFYRNWRVHSRSVSSARVLPLNWATELWQPLWGMFRRVKTDGNNLRTSTDDKRYFNTSLFTGEENWKGCESHVLCNDGVTRVKKKKTEKMV